MVGVWRVAWFALGAYAVQNQTAHAKEVLEAVQKRAAQLSEAAKPSVLQYFDDPTFRQQISTLHNITHRTAAELLRWYEGNIEKTDVIVTFHFEVWDTILQAGHMFNKWQLLRAGKGFADFSLRLAEYVETHMFNFRPLVNYKAPTEEEADTRPLYFAVNLWKKANGDPMYGDTNFVVYPAKKKYLMLAPSDSGWWYKACIMKQTTTPPVDCTKYPAPENAVGTFDHFYHLILTHNLFYQYPISDLFKRFYNDSFAKPPAEVNYYYEADMAAAFFVPHDVWYTILDSLKLWGTAQAHQIQQWHAQNKRPMTWSGEVNHMFIDPIVGMFGGYNVTAKDKTDFNSLWTSLGPADWFKLYNSIGRGLHLYVLRQGDCGSGYCGSACDYIGLNSLGNCIFTGHK